MEENKDIETTEIDDSAIAPKMSFGKWVENVWYHYKWQIIISIFAIVVLAVCITQCAKNAKDEPDIHILYAGSVQIAQPNDRQNGSTPFRDLESALASLTSDYNEDGEKIVNLETVYWIPDGKRQDTMGPDNSTMLTDAYYVSLFNESIATIDALRQKSNYFIWFVSPDVYNYVKSQASGAFIPLAPYGATADMLYDASGDAIKLESLTTAFALSGIGDLPDDTLVVLRAPTVLERGDNEAFATSEAFLKMLIALG